MNRKQLRILLALGVFVLALLIYLRTLTPKLGWIDSGELSVICATFGVAHPPGYPLYTLLGRLFVQVPLGEICQRVSFMSALFASLGAMLAFLILAGDGSEPNRLAGGVAAGLLLAFSNTFWSQAVDQEVYPLTAFLIPFLIFFLSRWAKKPSLRGLAALAYFGGLALGNHLTLMWTGLAALALVLWTCRKAVFNKALWLYLVLFFLGLSLYAVLVIRAWHNPLLSWGDVRTLKHLYWHLTTKQYQVWLFSGKLDVLSANFKRFLGLWLHEFTPWAFGLGVLGILSLLRRNRPWLAFLSGVFLLHTFFALNYEIPNIERYFIPAFLVWALFSGEGIAWVLGLLEGKAGSGGLVKAARLILPLIFLLPLLGNWKMNDRSRNYIPYDYGQNYLRSAEPNALVLTMNWDIYSPILYIKYVEKTRTDVAFVDKELLRRSWYFKYLREQYPWLIQASEPEVASYLELLDEFEAGTLKDNNEIQRRYLEMINSFIDKSMSGSPPRPVYITFDRAMDSDYPGIASTLNKIPCGVLYRLSPGDSVFPCNPSFELRGALDESIGKDERTFVNLLSYPKLGYERAALLGRHRRYAEAAAVLNGLLEWPINRAAVLGALGGCELEMGDLDQAQSDFEEVLREAPRDPEAQRGLNEIARRRNGNK